MDLRRVVWFQTSRLHQGLEAQSKVLGFRSWPAGSRSSGFFLTIWEFPKIGDPNLVPYYIVGSLI